MNRRSRLAWIALAVVLALLVVWMVMRKKPAPQATAEAAPTALAVTLARPQQAQWAITLNANGAITPWQEAIVGAEAGGLRIVRLNVDVGSRVKRGDVLAVLSQDTVQAEVRKAEASLAQTQAALSEARSSAERARAIRASGALSEQQVAQYQVAEQTARANVAAAQAALETARLRMRQTQLLAVDDGVVSSRTATLGSVVGAGTELFRLVRQNRLEWRAEISGQHLAQVKPGQRAHLLLPDGSRVDGSVRSIAPTLSPETRMALVYVDLPAESQARAGMYATGEIELGQRAALTLPSAALIMRDGRGYVFEIGPGNRVIQRLVTVGRQQADRVEITKGLAADAQVAATGGAFLNDGDVVRIGAPASAASTVPEFKGEAAQ